MKRRCLSSACLLAGILLSPAAEGPTANSRYDRIPERNVFGLVPMKTNVVEKVVEPLPNVLLTGITTILKTKYALLSVQTRNQPVEFCTLAEGQAQAGVQVLRIDEKSGTVQLKNRDTIQTVDFKANGAKQDPKALNLAGLPLPGLTPRTRTSLPTPPMPVR